MLAAKTPVVTAAVRTRYTPEDLLAMPEGFRYELIDGELVPRNMSVKSSHVGRKVNHRIDLWNDEHQLGLGVGSDCGLEIFPWLPGHVRFSDGAFLLRSRVPADFYESGHLRVAPDLVLEVVSPGDIADEVEHKVSLYLRAGVPIVWVVYPNDRTVYVHTAPGTRRLTEDDTLDGGEVLPGFAVRVGELFV